MSYESALKKLDEVIVGGGGAATIAFSSIDQRFRSLQILCDLRGDLAAAQTALCVQYNGDTGANYDDEYLYANSSGVATSQQIGGTSHYMCDINAASAPSGVSSGVDMIIFNYAGTTFQKECRATSTLKNANSNGSLYFEAGGHWWRSTAAITSILLFPASGNFVSGSTASLYGIV